MNINDIVNSQTDLLKKISSGKRIESAKDDPAGLSLTNSLTNQINGNSQYIVNSLDAINYINTSDSAYNNINNDASRIRELTVQAGNGIYGSNEKEAIQEEINALQNNINQTINNTEFAGQPIFNNNVNFSTSDNSNLEISSNVSNLNIDINDPNSLDNIDDYISQIQREQAELGAQANRLESTVNNLITENVNQESSRSQISDLDYSSSTSQKSINEVRESIMLAIQKEQNYQKGNILNILV